MKTEKKGPTKADVAKLIDKARNATLPTENAWNAAKDELDKAEKEVEDSAEMSALKAEEARLEAELEEFYAKTRVVQDRIGKIRSKFEKSKTVTKLTKKIEELRDDHDLARVVRRRKISEIENDLLVNGPSWNQINELAKILGVETTH